MEYCGPRGIAHSEFLRWDPDDQDKALAWLLRDRQRCRSCGTHPDEWDPEQGGDMQAFEWQLTHCRGCEVTAQGDEHLDGLKKSHQFRRGTSVHLARPTPDES